MALVINSQSQNEYKCTQDVFRVLKKIIIRTFFHENNDFKKHDIAIKILIILKPHVIFQFFVQFSL